MLGAARRNGSKRCLTRSHGALERAGAGRDVRASRNAARSEAQGHAPDPHMWNDTWSGYLPARQRMIDLMARQRRTIRSCSAATSTPISSTAYFATGRSPATIWSHRNSSRRQSPRSCAICRRSSPTTANKDVVAFYDNAAPRLCQLRGDAGCLRGDDGAHQRQGPRQGRGDGRPLGAIPRHARRSRAEAGGMICSHDGSAAAMRQVATGLAPGPRVQALAPGPRGLALAPGPRGLALAPGPRLCAKEFRGRRSRVSGPLTCTIVVAPKPRNNAR